MKKIKVYLTCLLSMALFTACGQKTGECEACGKTAPLYRFYMSYIISEEDGEEEIDELLCKECVDKEAEWFDGFGDVIGTEMPYIIEEYKGK